MRQNTLCRVTKNAILSFMLVFLPFLFLYAPPSGGMMGVIGAVVYLGQYFFILLTLARVQPRPFIAPCVGFINGALLFALKLSYINSHDPLDFSLAIVPGCIAFLNIIISSFLCLFFVIRKLRNEQHKSDNMIEQK